MGNQISYLLQKLINLFKFKKTQENKQEEDILSVSSEDSNVEYQNPIVIKDIKCEKNYNQILQDQCFQICDLPESSIILKKSKSNLSKKQKRIQNEIKVLAKNLPVTDTNAIFVRQNQRNVDQFQTIITGTKGTPYAYGCFLFDMVCHDSFPTKPPEIKILTTGGNQIRFNPNLYNSGYVCLSIVGTWGNTWSEQNNIYQILVSIQSLVMNEDVIYQEPSYNNGKSNKEFQKQNIGYQNIVKYGNLKYAMNQMITNPPIGFKDVIQTHFYLNKHNIIKEVQQWVDFAKRNDSQTLYNGLVSSHNHSIAALLQKNFQKCLNEEFQNLKYNLEKLNLDIMKNISFVAKYLNQFKEQLQDVQVENVKKLKQKFQLQKKIVKKKKIDSNQKSQKNENQQKIQVKRNKKKKN